MKTEYKKKLEELMNYDKTALCNRTYIPEEYGREAIISNIVKNAKYKIAIYGAGRMGIATWLWLKERVLETTFFIDKAGGRGLDEKVNIFDMPVLNMAAAKEKFEKDSFLVLVAVNRGMVELKNIEKELLYNGAAEVIICDRKNYYVESWSKDILENKVLLLEVLDKLADEESKEAYVEFFRVKLTRDFYRAKEYDFTKKYFCGNLFDMSQIKHYVCLGGYTGDSVLRFIDENSSFDSVVIFEPQDKYLFEMEHNFKYCPMCVRKKIKVIAKEAGNADDWKTASIDQCADKVDLISMDIEGGELEALKGARNTINNEAPVLALSAYHKYDDFPEFIEYISKCNSHYRFYVRKYRSHISVPANEIVLYAIPSNKCI